MATYFEDIWLYFRKSSPYEGSMKTNGKCNFECPGSKLDVSRTIFDVLVGLCLTVIDFVYLWSMTDSIEFLWLRSQIGLTIVP